MATLGPFWEALFAAGEPWVVAHPFLQLPEARRSAVPIFLHADEAKYINKGEQKCYVVSISSLARGSAPATKFLVAALPVEVFTEETLWAFLDWVAFDLTALQQGTFPAKGWRGAELDPQRQKLAGRPAPVRCVFAGVKGDAKWLLEAYKWGRSSSAIPFAGIARRRGCLGRCCGRASRGRRNGKWRTPRRPTGTGSHPGRHAGIQHI